MAPGVDLRNLPGRSKKVGAGVSVFLHGSVFLRFLYRARRSLAAIWRCRKLASRDLEPSASPTVSIWGYRNLLALEPHCSHLRTALVRTVAAFSVIPPSLRDKDMGRISGESQSLAVFAPICVCLSRVAISDLPHFISQKLQRQYNLYTWNMQGYYNRNRIIVQE